MNVGELLAALQGVNPEATVHCSVTYSWDGDSGDALGSEATETEVDGPDWLPVSPSDPDSLRMINPATAIDFSIICEVPYDDVLKAAGVIIP